MNQNDASGQEPDDSVDEQRAQYERFAFTVGSDGGVTVENRSYGDESGEHAYSVDVRDGEAVGCSCPHATHRGAHCKHQRAVENAPLVVSSASAVSSTPALAVATDGGHEDPETDADDDTDARTCSDCGETFDSFLEFARHDRGGECDDGETETEGYERPTRSEPADFGGGESTGIDEL